jgi:hypothetical protein
MLKTIFVGTQEFVVTRSVYRKLLDILDGDQIDRDPVCFPIIAKYLQGYSLKSSQVRAVANRSGLTISDFLKQLYEDALIYNIPGLEGDMDELIRKNWPEYCYDFHIASSPNEDFGEEVESFLSYFAVSCEFILLSIISLFKLDVTVDWVKYLQSKMRQSIHANSENLAALYRWKLILCSIPGISFLYRIIMSMILYSKVRGKCPL